MPSFRERVLDALDIHKRHVKLAINDRFPKVYTEGTSAQVIVDGNDVTVQRTELNNDVGNTMCNYAISRQIIGEHDLHYDGTNNPGEYGNTRPGFIGPNVGNGVGIRQTLDILGFVVGDPPPTGKQAGIGGHTSLGSDAQGNAITDIQVYKNSYPECTNRVLEDEAERKLYNGFWHINGIYDNAMTELKSMRKSAVEPFEYDTQFPQGQFTPAGENEAANLPEHTHKDWPDQRLAQHRKLEEDPYADSLYYHSMKIKMLIKGITIPATSEQASNHRGLVRLLVVKPKMPSVKVRWTGDTNAPIINMAYPPHWDTDLFYTSTRTLAGNMDPSITRDTAGNDAHYTHLSPSFGLFSRRDVAPEIDYDPNSIHYGHEVPNLGTHHDLSAFQHMTAPINRKNYTVLEDKTFTLDTLHHGVASQRLEHITIPFNKRVRFGGRLQDGGNPESSTLTLNTNNEPLNLHSKPVILLMSMDQKLSVQIEGYTGITEC